MISEEELQRGIIDLAHWTGWLAHHTRPVRVGTWPNGSPRWETPIQGDPGFVDLVLAKPDRAPLLWELKSERGVVDANQRLWVRALGGQVIRPRDWISGAVERILKK